MKYKTLQINLVLFISLLSINPLLAALPGNISDLVESSAPAVVNITSTREVAQRQSNNYGGIPDEMLERLVYQGNIEKPLKQKERQYLMGQVLFLRKIIF